MEPLSDEELQKAANAADFILALESLGKLDALLMKPSPEAIKRCEEILRQAAQRGIKPNPLY